MKTRQPKLQELFAFYAWGKPADRLELDALEPQKKIRLILRYDHEDPDSPNYRLPKTVPGMVAPSLLVPPNVAREMQRRLKGPEAS